MGWAWIETYQNQALEAIAKKPCVFSPFFKLKLAVGAGSG